MKKINFTSSSNERLRWGFYFLSLLSSTINFSTKRDKVSSIRTDLSLSVGTDTILSFSTIFSTIFYLGTWTILGYNKNSSSWTRNFSIISICIFKLGLLVLSFLSSANKISKLTLISFVKIFNLCSWVATSTPTATPSYSFSVISWTYFNTSTIWGITTIFSTIFSKIYGTSTSFYSWIKT